MLQDIEAREQSFELPINGRKLGVQRIWFRVQGLEFMEGSGSSHNTCWKPWQHVPLVQRQRATHFSDGQAQQSWTLNPEASDNPNKQGKQAATASRLRE